MHDRWKGIFLFFGLLFWSINSFLIAFGSKTYIPIIHPLSCIPPSLFFFLFVWVYFPLHCY
ncbi:hypothetical protein F4809DRAFT_633503 [Biscogniauxia mediterranea]|nr:hypothetical protein F4809DRAFT_633503 [Biscogniauxia mediterranea]